jgi:hypothetical protein
MSAELRLTTGATAGVSVTKEVWEESGFDVNVRKLAAVWDRARPGHTPDVFFCCKVFFICEIIGGVTKSGLETSQVGWFGEDELPRPLSRPPSAKPDPPLSVSRLSAPVERSIRSYIQSTTASVLYLSSSWTPAWRNN